MKKVFALLVVMMVALAMVGCSSSSKSSYGSSYSDYDGKISNDELHNFINSYDGKW